MSDGTNAYLYGNSRIAQYKTTMHAFSSFGADALGSVRQMYDSAGQVIADTRYDPCGNVVTASGAATSAYGFVGEQQDAGTGLKYLWASIARPIDLLRLSCCATMRHDLAFRSLSDAMPK